LIHPNLSTVYNCDMATLPRSLSRCRQCTFPWRAQLSSSTRQFSTTALLKALGPESPKWIDVPESIQPPQKRPGPVKGILPVPKKIVTEKTQAKTTDEYLNRAARHPRDEKWILPGDENAGYRVWHSKMAKTRRQHLREGTKRLFERHVKQKNRVEYAQMKEREKILQAQLAPERLDDEYTKASVSEAVRYVMESKSNKAVESEEDRKERERRYQEIVVQKSQTRMDQLHNLYMNARDFIVTKEQLESEIEKVFGADDSPVVWPGNRISVWGLRKPLSTAELSGVLNVELGTVSERRTKALNKRMYRLAGELTGGDIDIPKHMRTEDRFEGQ
jgi:hypothetical protein